MFFNLSDHTHTFNRLEHSRLVSVIPLCARTVIFFCDDHTFYHYCLLDEKILYQSKLSGRVRSAISISGHQILCSLIETRNLVRLNIHEKSIDEICKIPITKIYNEGRERDVLTQITLHLFEKSSSFYIAEPIHEESIVNMYFHNCLKNQETKISPINFECKKINTKMNIVKKLDSVSQLVRFNQQIEDNGVFKFVTFDCQNNFEEKQYECRNNSFTRFSIVKDIRKISKQDENESILLFVNNNEPSILILTDGQVEQYTYKTNKVFLSTIMINIQLGFGVFMFLPDPEDIDPDYNSVLDLVCLKNGVVQDSRKCVVHDLIKSFEDDYLLQFRPEKKKTNTSTFQTHHIINKKTHYIKWLWHKGFTDISVDLVKQIIEQLDSTSP